MMDEGGIDAAVTVLPSWGPRGAPISDERGETLSRAINGLGLTGARPAGVAVKAIGVPGYSIEAYQFSTLRTGCAPAAKIVRK